MRAAKETSMGVKSDRWFRERCMRNGVVVPNPMIEPYHPDLVREVDGRPVISFGQSSYGYDIRCGNEFKVFTNINSTEIDPKALDDSAFVTLTCKDGEHVMIPPHSFVLCASVEYFRIPRDVVVCCYGKSTYARAAQVVPITPLEPEWEGHLTLEIANQSSLPARLYAGEGICQLVFHGADIEMTDEQGETMIAMRGGSPEGVVNLRRVECETSYADRKGKYQGQRGITLSKV
jgi:dCTP deaminase